MDFLNHYLSSIKDLCERHNVASLYVFGSAVNNQLSPQSDIDFLVTFDSIELSNYYTNYLSLSSSLRELLNRDIDLVEEETLKNPILINSINFSKTLIYGPKNSKMAL